MNREEFFFDIFVEMIIRRLAFSVLVVSSCTESPVLKGSVLARLLIGPIDGGAILEAKFLVHNWRLMNDSRQIT